MFWRYIYLTILMILPVSLLVCCSDSAGPSKTDTFNDLVAQGWSAFSNADYENALQKFNQANGIHSESPEAYSGIGWTQFKRDELALADSAFRQGAAIDSAHADIYAGWAFSFNAGKNYMESNSKADSTLLLAPSWAFEHGLPLDVNDLQILRAENHFLLGNFVESLEIVLLLNSQFFANVATSSGQAALAVEIERLKSVF